MTNISLVLKLPALCCVFKKWEVCCVCMCVYFKGIFICGFSLMNPNPFLRKQFISGKLVSTQEPVCQEEGDSLETFCGSVCQCWTQSPGTRGRQRQRRHTHSHPADQSTACCVCGNYTHTHTHTHIATGSRNPEEVATKPLGRFIRLTPTWLKINQQPFPEFPGYMFSCMRSGGVIVSAHSAQ